MAKIASLEKALDSIPVPRNTIRGNFNVLTVSSRVGAQDELLCEECLVDLDENFIDNAASTLHRFLTSSEAYEGALEKTRENLRDIRQSEASYMAIQHLYREPL